MPQKKKRRAANCIFLLGFGTFFCTKILKSIPQGGAACIGNADQRGLGHSPNKYFAAQNKQMYIRLHCLRSLWSLSTRPPILKIILQSGPSVFRLKLKRTVIFLLGIISNWHSIASRTSCPVLSFHQSFHLFFLRTAESSVFSKVFVDTARFLW